MAGIKTYRVHVTVETLCFEDDKQTVIQHVALSQQNLSYENLVELQADVLGPSVEGLSKALVALGKRHAEAKKTRKE